MPAAAEYLVGPPSLVRNSEIPITHHWSHCRPVVRCPTPSLRAKRYKTFWSGIEPNYSGGAHLEFVKLSSRADNRTANRFLDAARKDQGECANEPVGVLPDARRKADYRNLVTGRDCSFGSMAVQLYGTGLEHILQCGTKRSREAADRSLIPGSVQRENNGSTERRSEDFLGSRNHIRNPSARHFVCRTAPFEGSDECVGIAWPSEAHLGALVSVGRKKFNFVCTGFGDAPAHRITTGDVARPR